MHHLQKRSGVAGSSPRFEVLPVALRGVVEKRSEDRREGGSKSVTVEAVGRPGSTQPSFKPHVTILETTKARKFTAAVACVLFAEAVGTHHVRTDLVVARDYPQASGSGQTRHFSAAPLSRTRDGTRKKREPRQGRRVRCTAAIERVSGIDTRAFRGGLPAKV